MNGTIKVKANGILPAQDAELRLGLGNGKNSKDKD
jgi:hypothetical protein